MSDCNAQGSVEHNMPRGCEQTQTKPTPGPNQAHTRPTPNHHRPGPRQSPTNPKPSPDPHHAHARMQYQTQTTLSKVAQWRFPPSLCLLRTSPVAEEGEPQPAVARRESAVAPGPVRGGYTQPTRLRSFLLTAISFLFSCSRCTLKRTFPFHHRN